jgi:hypothetical protein
MKRFFFTLAILALPVLSWSQVFNTATTLKPGKISLGLNPVVYNEDFGLFLHGGIGIVPGVDLALHYGFLDYDDYFGADIEWRLLSGKPSLSLITGAHKHYDAGLDLGLNLSFPIASKFQLYTGIDTDINFGHGDSYSHVWLPIGVEIPLKTKMSFMFEAEIPLNNYAFSIFGGGISFYF